MRQNSWQNIAGAIIGVEYTRWLKEVEAEEGPAGSAAILQKDV